MSGHDGSTITSPATSHQVNGPAPSLPAYGIVLLVFMVMAARLFRLTYRYAVNIFFWDQWGFSNATLFQKHSLWQMFRWQYGPHRLGLGPLVSTLIEPHFRWNSRSESFIACTIIVLAAACALCLKKRLFGEIRVWDVAIPILYLSASQYESIFTNSNLAHGPLPLLLLTLYCLAWTISNVVNKYAIVLGLNFVIIYTGFGIFLGFLTPLLLIADYWVNLKGKPKHEFYFALALLIAGASLASFFYGYTLQPAVNCFSLKLQQPFQYLWYASLMFANFWANGTGIFPRLIGCAVMVSLLWTLASAGANLFKPTTRTWARCAVPATLAGYSLLFSLNAAIGRLCLGLGSADASRYMAYLALGLFGVYLHLLSVPVPNVRRAALGVSLVALLATVPIRAQDRGLMRFFSELKRSWRNCYLAGGSIPACDAVAGYKIDPEPEHILQQKLDYLKEMKLNMYADTK